MLLVWPATTTLGRLHSLAAFQLCVEDDGICIKVGGCSEANEKKRQEEQLPFPKFFQEEFFLSSSIQPAPITFNNFLPSQHDQCVYYY